MYSDPRQSSKPTRFFVEMPDFRLTRLWILQDGTVLDLKLKRLQHRYFPWHAATTDDRTHRHEPLRVRHVWQGVPYQADTHGAATGLWKCPRGHLKKCRQLLGCHANNVNLLHHDDILSFQFDVGRLFFLVRAFLCILGYFLVNRIELIVFYDLYSTLFGQVCRLVTPVNLTRSVAVMKIC